MSLKIFFCGSIKGGGNDAELYSMIVQQLQLYGTVLNFDEHVIGNGSNSKDEREDDAKFVHDRSLMRLSECDVLVAEVTQPSLGVGYEIAKVENLKKPILCLYRPDAGKTLSQMIEGAQDGNLVILKEYKTDEIVDVLKTYFTKK